jgi:hypothetical protein
MLLNLNVRSIYDHDYDGMSMTKSKLFRANTHLSLSELSYLSDIRQPETRSESRLINPHLTGYSSLNISVLNPSDGRNNLCSTNRLSNNYPGRFWIWINKPDPSLSAIAPGQRRKPRGHPIHNFIGSTELMFTVFEPIKFWRGWIFNIGNARQLPAGLKNSGNSFSSNQTCYAFKSLNTFAQSASAALPPSDGADAIATIRKTFQEQ